MERPETVRFAELDLDAVEGGDPEARWLAGFPFSPDRPGETTAAATECTVVYNEIDPGNQIGTHTDAVDELLFVLAGTVEAVVGGETTTASAGSVTVVPAEAEHEVRNTGTETAELVGVFGTAPVDSTFETDPTVVTPDPDDD